MKKLLILIGLLAGLTVSSRAATIVATGTTNGFYLISTNRASLYSVTLSAGTTGGTIQLFDCDSVAAPFFGTNYTNASFPYTITYSTNIASSFVGQNGYTNWYTNAGIFTLAKTNSASTNTLPAMWVGAVGANQAITYNADALFTRGVCATIPTNISLILNYRTGQ